jgi:hypothetical protein
MTQRKPARGTARKTARKPTRNTARKAAQKPAHGSAHQSARKPPRRWSAAVTRHSDALDLEGGVFTLSDPKRIAGSLKRSALRSKRRKADPYRSALSMLTFYLNRAGKNLPAARRRTLGRAKVELRRQFGRDGGEAGKRAPKHAAKYPPKHAAKRASQRKAR